MPKAGRKNTPVASLFKDVASSTKVAKVKCNFCSINIVKNGTRMLKHISNCKKCGEEIKMKYLKPKGKWFMGTDSKCETTVSTDPENNVVHDSSITGMRTYTPLIISEDPNTTVTARTPQPTMQSFFEKTTPISESTTEAPGGSGTTSRPTSGRMLFSPQMNKLTTYMDHMSDAQTVSTTYNDYIYIYIPIIETV